MPDRMVAVVACTWLCQVRRAVVLQPPVSAHLRAEDYPIIGWGIQERGDFRGSQIWVEG